MTENQTILLRGAVVIGLGIYLHVGPALDVLADSPVKWGQRWRMFHGYGIDVCDVQFFDYSKSRTEPIDRYDAMGVKVWYGASKSTRRMDNPDHIRAQAMRICRRIKVDDPEIRAIARCGSRKGWKPVMNKEANLCIPQPRKPRTPRKKK